MKRTTVYEVYKVCTGGRRPCPHEPDVEYWEDDCNTRETAERIAARIAEQSTPRTCQLQPVIYEITKSYQRIN